jgi:predicted nucleotidyltransferase
VAQVSPAVERSVRRFLETASRGRRIAAAYLYGSHVRGTATEWSDIDVAVVSPDFAGDLFTAQLALMKLAARIDDRIEPRAFTPESFNEDNPLASVIQHTGIRVA